MSHHEQGEKLGHQITCNDGVKAIEYRRGRVLTEGVSVTMLVFLLVIWESYLLQTIYYVIFLLGSCMKLRWRMCNEGHTSLVYSRFNDNIHTRTVSWLIFLFPYDNLNLSVYLCARKIGEGRGRVPRGSHYPDEFG